MALSLSKTPAKVALIGNPVSFEIHSDSFLDNAGVRAQSKIIFGNTAAVDQSIRLSWDDKEIVFTCKANPDSSGTQFQDNSVVANLNDWVALTAGYIASNYYINQDFEVSASGSELIFNSRGDGAQYSLYIDLSNLSTFPASISQILAGEDLSQKPFYKIGLQSLILEDQFYKTLSEDSLPVDSDGKASFDIRSHFSGVLRSDPNFPESSENLIIHHPEMCRKFKVRYFEGFGNPIAKQGFNESDEFFALIAGVSRFYQAKLNQDNKSFFDKICYNRFFLSWHPEDKISDPYQTEKLYYLVHTDAQSLNLKLEITLNDGSVSTITKATLTSPEKYQVYEFVLSLFSLQIDGWDQGQVATIKAWIQDHAGNRISEYRRYLYDYTPYEGLRRFLFKNSLGAFESLRTTGLGETSLEYTENTFTRSLSDRFTPSDHYLGKSRPEETQGVKVNTGIFNKDQFEWIRDFLLSDQVYLTYRGVLIPVVIKGKSIRQKKDREDMYNLAFEYALSHKSSHYSRLEDDPLFNDDFMNDFELF